MSVCAEAVGRNVMESPRSDDTGTGRPDKSQLKRVEAGPANYSEESDGTISP